MPLKVDCLCEVGSQIFCEKTGSAGGGGGVGGSIRALEKIKTEIILSFRPIITGTTIIVARHLGA